MVRRASYFVALFGAAMLVSTQGCRLTPHEDRVPKRLPIYRLAAPAADAARVLDVADRIFGIENDVQESSSGLVARSGSKMVEICPDSGAIWAADEGVMWDVYEQPTLVGESEAKELARRFFAQSGVLPVARAPALLGEPVLGGTWASLFDEAGGSRVDKQLDVQVVYPLQLQIAGETYPIVGGGGEFHLTLGDAGSVIGYSGVWREIDAIEVESPVISRSEADRQFLDLMKNMRLASYDATLAYYSAPTGVRQEYLYPVWVYRAEAISGTETIPLRNVLLPATEFGPALRIPAPQQVDTRRGPPQPGSDAPETDLERGTDTGLDERELFRSGGRGQPLNHGSDSGGGYRRVAQSSWKEAGTSWIGTSQGLPGSQGNAAGFRAMMALEGWSINFNWGDQNAFESDWNRNDDQWVDAADFVFYTGHAGMSSWNLFAPDDSVITSTDVGSTSPRDLWGGNDAEWIVVAACGPLQDAGISSGGGSARDRWKGAFDGLHQLLGYSSITYDNELEGLRLGLYCRQGTAVLDSWFRAARETQPTWNGASSPNGPLIYVSALYAYRYGVTSPRYDRIHGRGFVSQDPVPVNGYVLIWTLA